MASQISSRQEGSFFKERRTFKKRDAKGWPIGPRTERRMKENAKLNKLPDHVKNFCEIQLKGCLRNKFLSWQHSKKSRFIVTSKDWQEAARACAFCADALDFKMGHEEMERLVKQAIRSRKL